MANSVDPDQMHSAASDLVLHCLLRPDCPNAYDYYGSSKFNLLQLKVKDLMNTIKEMYDQKRYAKVCICVKTALS